MTGGSFTSGLLILDSLSDGTCLGSSNQMSFTILELFGNSFHPKSTNSSIFYLIWMEVDDFWESALFGANHHYFLLGVLTQSIELLFRGHEVVAWQK